MPTIEIHNMEHDAAAGGWFVHAKIVSADGTVRTGPQFVELGFYATEEQIRAALAAMYP